MSYKRCKHSICRNSSLGRLFAIQQTVFKPKVPLTPVRYAQVASISIAIVQLFHSNRGERRFQNRFQQEAAVGLGGGELCIDSVGVVPGYYRE